MGQGSLCSGSGLAAVLLVLGEVAATAELVEVVAVFAFGTFLVFVERKLVAFVEYSEVVVGRSSRFGASFEQIAVKCDVSMGHSRPSWKV